MQKLKEKKLLKKQEKIQLLMPMENTFKLLLKLKKKLVNFKKC
jgi:hypothetical protein